MFERKEKSVSPKKRLLRMFRLIGGSRKGNQNVSLPTPVFTATPSKPMNSIINLGAELQKAQALMYLRVLDRLK